MSTDEFQQKLICDKCGETRVVSLIKLEKPGFLKGTMSEQIEKEHRRMAEETTDPDEKKLHLALAEGQRRYREEGHIILNMRCVQHPLETEHILYLDDLEKLAMLVKDNWLRCGKCGQNVEVLETKTSGTSTILEVRCADHGEAKPTIPTKLYNILMKPSAPSKPAEPAAAIVRPDVSTRPGEPEAKSTPPAKPAAVKTKYCWKCGTRVISPEAQYCHKCGNKLRT